MSKQKLGRIGHDTGIALGLFGAVDHSSKKVYPVLGLILNVAILALFVTMVLIGLSIMHPSGASDPRDFPPRPFILQMVEADS
jgi:hypothetical protein